MDIRIDTSELQAMSKRYAGAQPIVRQELVSGMWRLGDIGRTEAHRRVPVDTARLKSSINREVTQTSNEVVVKVGSGVAGEPVKYAMHVEFGTGPRLILPVNKKALWWPGARHPVAYVNHPGTRAKPYLRPALAEMVRQSGRIMQEVMRRVMTRIGGGR
jgi:HK97 gp10 family phage protein